MKTRVRGFERPLSTNQLISWVGNALATGGFYAVTGAVLLSPRGCNEATVAILVLPHLVLVVGGFSCWLFLESHIPTKPSIFGRLLPDSERWTRERYSREHKDVVAGLDHYCTWLNTAIGRANYVPFYCIACFGTFQYALHVAILVYMLVVCGPKDLGLVFLIVAAALAFAGLLILIAYAALFGFHTYLFYLDMGTYDWIIHQRQLEQQVELARPRTGRVTTNEGDA